MTVIVTQLIDGEQTGRFDAVIPDWAEGSELRYLEAKSQKEDWFCEWITPTELHTWKEYARGPVRRKDRYFRIV